LPPRRRPPEVVPRTVTLSQTGTAAKAIPSGRRDLNVGPGRTAGAASAEEGTGSARSLNGLSPGESADVIRESGHGRGLVFGPNAANAAPAADPAVTPVATSGGARPVSARPPETDRYSTIFEAQLREGTLTASDANHFKAIVNFMNSSSVIPNWRGVSRSTSPVSSST
jgi:hypothetical protein